METKIQKLTAQETESLHSFIGKSVFENIAFPSALYGTNSNVTVQEIIHNKTIPQLQSYGSYIEKTYLNTGSRFDKSKASKTWGSITVDSLINFLELVIKYKEYLAANTKIEKEIQKLEEEQEQLKTPEERKKEIQARLSLLKSTEQ